MIIYDILKKTKLSVRAICPRCKKFRKIILGNNEEIIEIKNQ